MAARNPTHFGCSSDINALHSTDYRPSKALYVDVKDSNQFRLFLQHNADKIRMAQFKKFEQTHRCCACEYQPKNIVAFDSGSTCNNTPGYSYPPYDIEPKDNNITGYK